MSHRAPTKHAVPPGLLAALHAAQRLLLLVALVLAGCGATGQPGYITEQQAVDGLTITLERPEQIELLKDYEIFVTLTDAAGQPVENAIVFLDLSMPAMEMGTNQPIADPLGQGRYRAKALFTMDGDWHTTVHASIAGKEYTARFAHQVVPQAAS